VSMRALLLQSTEAKEQVFRAQDIAGRLDNPHVENIREWLSTARSLLEAVDREVRAFEQGAPATKRRRARR
jgi:hypothetical protein